MESVPPELDTETLESLRELADGVDAGFVARYFTAFLGNIPAQLAGMREALRLGDPLLLAQHAHAIKSSCANSGALGLMDLCGRVEAIGKSGSCAGAEMKCVEIEARFARLEIEIRALPEMRENAGR